MNKLKEYTHDEINQLMLSQDNDISVSIENIFAKFGYKQKVIHVNENIELDMVKKLQLSNLIQMDEKYKIKSVCHNVYSEQFFNTTGYRVVKGKCFRSEKYTDEYRRKEFNMIELVVHCLKKDEINYLNDFINIFIELCKILPNESMYKIAVATDSFIDDEAMVNYQKIFKTKYELLVYSKKNKKYISIGSINRHMNSFTTKFNVPNNHCTLCIGFGVERIAQIIEEYV